MDADFRVFQKYLDHTSKVKNLLSVPRAFIGDPQKTISQNITLSEEFNSVSSKSLTSLTLQTADGTDLILKSQGDGKVIIDGDLSGGLVIGKGYIYSIGGSLTFTGEENVKDVKVKGTPMSGNVRLSPENIGKFSLVVLFDKACESRPRIGFTPVSTTCYDYKVVISAASDGIMVSGIATDTLPLEFDFICIA
jgi:hypothetical protein